MQTENTQTSFFSESSATKLTEQSNIGVSTDSDIKSNTVILSLSIGGVGFTRKVTGRLSDDESGIDETMLSTSKSLIDKRYLAKISAHESELRSSVARIGFKPQFLKGGFTLLTAMSVKYVESLIVKAQEERKVLIEELIENLPEAKEDARERLGRLYRESEYPTAADIRCKFTIERNYMAMSVPTVLQSIDAEIFDRQIQESEKQWAEVSDNIVDTLTESFTELVNAMVDKLNPTDGKKKVFRSGYVRDMKEFLETFDLRNITNNKQLKEMVDKARSILDGENPQSIKRSFDKELRVKKVFTEIQQNLGEMVEKRGGRNIIL